MLRAACVALSLLPCFSQAAEPWQPYVKAESFSYSEPVSVYSALHDLSGEFDRGDVAFTRDRLELGVRKGNWEFALFDRYDYYLAFNPDTAELMYRDENKLTLDRNRTYVVDMKANHLRAKGIKIAYSFEPTGQLTLKFSGNLLYGSALVDGNVKGLLTTRGDDSFLLQAEIDYSYSDDILLNRQVEEPSGIGAAFDAAFEWRMSDKITLTGRFDDLVNRIFWKSAPFTLGEGTNATTRFDENGLLVVRPSLRGVEAFRRHTQRMPVYTVLSGYFGIGRSADLVVIVEHLMPTTLPTVGYRRRLGDNSFFSLLYGIKNQAFGLSYERENLCVKLVSDALPFNRAHTLDLTLSYRLTRH